ncbi:MAG: helix-turn-helix domain-containing protein [Ruminococcaceae bacterium]|nr:helix-turn-helix domain-containing protein [Oscillospiraceae bacterium]
MEQKNQSTVTLNVLDMRIKVIRVGNSPRLKKVEQISRNRMRRIHSHFTYEAFFVTEGALTLMTETEQRVYERKIVIVPPRVGHYTVASGNGSFCLLFSFEKSKQGAYRADLVRERLNRGVCELALSRDLEYYVRAIARKTETDEIGSERDAALLPELVFGELMRELLPCESLPEPVKIESKHIAEIGTFVNSNYHRRIALSDVAAHVYLSTRQVSRILQREYGFTLSELVTEKRLAQAKMLLKNTDESVGKIALRVGIGSENYFFSLFKKRYGITPLKYRKERNANAYDE